MSFLWVQDDGYKVGKRYVERWDNPEFGIIQMPFFVLAHATKEEYDQFWNEQQELRGLPHLEPMPPGVYYRVSID